MEKKSFKVTPWEVEGKIDYNKLIKEFGTQEISPALLKRVEKHAKELHLMLRRGVFFSHRDFDFILNEYEKGKKFFLYTGRGPSGKVHIGHLLPWILCKWFQDKFNVNMYFQLTDDEKFYTKKNLSLEDTKKLAYENALDFIALGFSPEKTKIIIDTKDIALLYPLAAEVAKKLTFSTAKAVFGFTNETNVGLIFYTSLQSAPCFLEDKPCLIPLGIDQDPHFRITRDIAPKLKKYKLSFAQYDASSIAGNWRQDVRIRRRNSRLYNRFSERSRAQNKEIRLFRRQGYNRRTSQERRRSGH